MSKTKMRCNTCGKWFQSANAKDLTCPDCTQKARKEKLVAKTMPPQPGRPAGQLPGTDARPVPPPPKPKPAASGTNQWLDSLNDVKVGEPDQPPPRPKFPPSSAPRDNRGDQEHGGYDRDRGPGFGGPGNYRDRDERGPYNYRDREGNRGPGGYREGNRGPGGYRDNGPGGYREGNRGPGGYREGGNRGPAPYHVGGGMGISGTIGQRPRQPMEGGPNRDRGQRPDKFRPGGKLGGPKAKGPRPQKPPAPPRPKKEKIPPPKPFEPTPEQVMQVENRYLELATPTEFDGIRTQISKELSIPKTAVKKIIKALRDRQNIPSWWEVQTYKGSEEELTKIREAYEPLLPVPPVGVHKQIADQLDLKPSVVYQAIKTIRQEMKLPQYNDPTLHGLEATPAKDVTQPEASADNANSVDSADDTNGANSATGADNNQPAQAETVAAEANGNQDAKAEIEAENNHELQAESKGNITSIETDTEFHREGNTIEVGAAPAAEQSDANAE